MHIDYDVHILKHRPRECLLGDEPGEIGYENLKRKIALLLAFAMMITMLPVSVAANPFQLGSATGMLWDASPASNVRHLFDAENYVRGGTVVAEQGRMSDFENFFNPGGHGDFSGLTASAFREAPGGPLRRIGVAADYFRGRGELTAAVSVGINNAWFLNHFLSAGNVPVTATTQTNMVSLSPVAQLAQAGGFQALMQLANGNSGSSTMPALDIRETTPGSVEAGLTTVVALAPAGVTAETLYNAIVRDFGTQAQGQVMGILVALAGSGETAHQSFAADLADAIVGGRVAAISLVTGNSWFMAYLETRTYNRADLRIARSGTDVYRHTTTVQLPIEYITRNGANTNPVHLLFTESSGWPHAGGPGRRTDLTTVADEGIRIARDGDLRTFHRYGRAQVGGNGIRFTEAAHGAFDFPNYFVDMRIVTPGFYWASGSAEATGSVRALDSAVAGITGVTVGNRQLGAFPIGDTADHNRNRRFTANVSLAGHANPARLVNDWFRIGVGANPLFVAANDRARPGTVVAEVRLYRADGVGAVQTGWDWQPAGHASEVFHTGITTDADRASVRAGRGAAAANAVVPQFREVFRRTVHDATGAITATTFVNARPTEDVFVTGDARQVGWVDATAPLLTGTDAGAGAVGRVRYQPVGRFNAVTTTFGGGAQGALVASEEVEIAVFGEVGLVLEYFTDADPANHVLRSGMQEWSFAETATATAQVGAINSLADINEENHRTARIRLRELVAGSMPGSGAQPIHFEFSEGVQVLGARIGTNEGHFSRILNGIPEDRRDGSVGRDRREVTFGLLREADNMLGATINRNSVVLRPEIGREADTGRRWRLAAIDIEFYISVMPGFEHYFNDDVIEVTVSTTVDGTPWSSSLVVAYAQDPIVVEVDAVDIDSAVGGLVHQAPIGDVTVTEVEAGLLRAGTRLGIFAEGGITRSRGTADHIGLRGSVRVVGDDHMRVSPIRHDSHGPYVIVERESRNDNAQIVFYDLQATGRVFDHTYNIFVADNAVAANWDGFNWLLDERGRGFGLNRGGIRGFWDNEPYATEAFTFDGTDVGFGAAPPTAVGPGPAPVRVDAPVRLNQFSSHLLSDGSVAQAPVFRLEVNRANPRYVTSYVAAVVVADIAGFDFAWERNDAGQMTSTFSNGAMEITFTEGSTSAMVNSVAVPILAAGLEADARLINDRMFVPISFFNTLPGFPLTVTWNPYVTTADRSITITPN